MIAELRSLEAEPTTRLTCSAPHPTIQAAGGFVRCGSFLGYMGGRFTCIGTARQAPAAPDGDVWVRCTNRRCGQWNRFRRERE